MASKLQSGASAYARPRIWVERWNDMTDQAWRPRFSDGLYRHFPTAFVDRPTNEEIDRAFEDMDGVPDVEGVEFFGDTTVTLEKRRARAAKAGRARTGVRERLSRRAFRFEAPSRRRYSPPARSRNGARPSS